TAARLLSVNRGRDEKHDETGAERLDETAAIQLEAVARAFEELVALGFDREARLAHARPPFAASLMAATIRGYVPQRQTLCVRSMAAAIASSVSEAGFEADERSATPAMIMPDVQ